MKRLITVLLCVLLMLSLIACSAKSDSVDETSPYADENMQYASLDTPSADNDVLSTQKDMQYAHAVSIQAPDDPMNIDTQIPFPKTGSIYTDYSMYTPYTNANDEIYTRLSKDFLPEIIPSDSYGTIVPYVGEYLGDNDGYDFAIFGLCTTDGMIITDPVYRSIYQTNGYNDSYGYISQQFPVYKLERLIAENEKMYISEGNISAVSIVPNIAICAIDGSWVTDYYYDVRFFGEFMLLYRENDADVFDYTGNFLYNTQDIHVDLQLNGEYIYWV